MSKKWLYHFEVTKEVHEKEEITTKNDKGEEVVTKKESTKKVPVTFAIQKPTRRMYEDGELFFAVKLSEGIKAGLLTKPLLAKRYKDDGGPLSDDEKERYAELFYEMASKQDDIEKLRLNLEKKDEKTRNKAAQELMTDIMTLREELQEYELAQSSLFDQTAENRAKNQTIMWWVLNLAYEKNGETRYNAVFGDGDHDSKLDKYDEIEEGSDPFWTEATKKFAYFITFWYLNGISDEKDFEEVEKIYKNEMGYFDENEEAEEGAKDSDEADEPEAEKEESKAEEEKEEPKAEEEKEEPEAEEKKEEPEAEEKKEEPKAEEKKEEPKAEEKKEEPKAEKKKAKKNAPKEEAKPVASAD